MTKGKITPTMNVLICRNIKTNEINVFTSQKRFVEYSGSNYNRINHALKKNNGNATIDGLELSIQKVNPTK